MNRRNILATLVASVTLLMCQVAESAASATVKRSCQTFVKSCLNRVDRAQTIAASTHSAVDSTFSSVTVCYQALDKARETGVWPAMGPFLPRQCVVE